jgi:hypothetical protein
MLQNEPCLHFGPWGVTEIFWGKIMRFYWKIAKYWKKCVIILFSPVSWILVNLLMMNVTGYHFWCPKHGLCVLLVILGQKSQIFLRKYVKLLPVNSIVFWITNNPCLPQQVIIRIFWKRMKNATKWAMFALWPIGRYEDILGQNHKTLLKNR